MPMRFNVGSISAADAEAEPEAERLFSRPPRRPRLVLEACDLPAFLSDVRLGAVEPTLDAAGLPERLRRLNAARVLAEGP